MSAEDKVLIAKIGDRARQCSENMMVTASAFLDMHERSLVAAHRWGYPDVKTVFYGGFDGAERVVAVMLPEYVEADDFDSLCAYFDECPENNPIMMLEVTKDNFSKPLTHRDYLGALMSLGIKREVTGDINVSENGCRIAVLAHMADFIAENLTKAGRGSLKAVAVPISHTAAEKASGAEESFTVSSMRLDSVIKNAFNLSRGAACEGIESGLVFVNDVECCKADKKILQGDKVVFRRKGRIIVRDCSSVSKKGRIIVKIEKFA